MVNWNCVIRISKFVKSWLCFCYVIYALFTTYFVLLRSFFLDSVEMEHEDIWNSVLILLEMQKNSLQIWSETKPNTISLHSVALANRKRKCSNERLVISSCLEPERQYFIHFAIAEQLHYSQHVSSKGANVINIRSSQQQSSAKWKWHTSNMNGSCTSESIKVHIYIHHGQWDASTRSIQSFE